MFPITHTHTGLFQPPPLGSCRVGLHNLTSVDSCHHVTSGQPPTGMGWLVFPRVPASQGKPCRTYVLTLEKCLYPRKALNQKRPYFTQGFANSARSDVRCSLGQRAQFEKCLNQPIAICVAFFINFLRLINF